MRNKIIIFLLFNFYLSYSQNSKNPKELNILIITNEKLIKSFKLNKDTTNLLIDIYINGYESKKKREKIISDYKKGNYIRTSISGPPPFFMTFESFKKPKKLISLDGINYISTTKFVKDCLERTNPTYIIYKQSDGTYLKWKCFDEMNIE